MRKLFITSLILNKFSCGEAHIPGLFNQETNIEVLCVYALFFQHNREQRHSVFARGCVEK